MRYLPVLILVSLFFMACSSPHEGTSSPKDGGPKDGGVADASCENERPILDPDWKPRNTYKDVAYRQEQSRIVNEGNSLPAGPVRGIVATTFGKAFAATDNGIFSISTDGRAEKFQGWPEEPVSAISLTGGGKLAAATEQEVWIGDPDAEPSDTPVPGNATKLAPAKDGGVWVILEGINYLFIIGENPADSDYFFGPWEDFSMRSVCDPGTGSVLLATDKGVWKMRVNAEGAFIEEFLRLGDGLPSEDARDIVCDESGVVWIGTAAGLVRHEGETTEVLDGHSGMPFPDVTSLSLSPDGRLLIGSDNGLMTLDTTTLQWDYYHTRYWLPDWKVHAAGGLLNGTIFAATEKGVGIIHGDEMTLAQKAEILDKGMYERHNRMGMFSDCSLDTAGDLSTARTRDDDNDGEWTALYLASQCFRYKATGSEEALSHARESMEALLRLETVTGKKGFLSRSVVEPSLCPQKQTGGGEWRLSDDGKWCWKGDTSSDEYVGHVFGLSIYYDLAASEAEKERIAEVFGDFHEGIIENGFVLQDLDGEPTMHGHFDPKWMKVVGQFGDAGLNSAMILGGLRAAYHMTCKQVFLDVFRRLAVDEGYAEYVRRIQQINTTGHINHDSEEMSFLALATLIRYETDPSLMAAWQEGLKYLWETQEPEHDPEFNMLYAWLSRSEENGIDDSVRTLKELYMHGIQWDVTNSLRVDYEPDPKADRFGQAQSLAVFPFDQKQFPRWAENPYRLDETGGGASERMLSPWLLPYWLGRFAGLITD